MVTGGRLAAGDRDGPEGRRGQVHTLEAFMGALLLIGSLAFALQVTAVTPLTASTSSQHIENQQLQMARGLLDAAVENGSLRETVLRWNASAGKFANASEEGYFATGGPPTAFGGMLNRTFRERGIAFNVEIHYVTAGDAIHSKRLVYVGSPSDHAVSVRRTLTLYDDDELTAPGSSGDLGSTSSYFAPDISSDDPLYNVVRVEVIVWRM